MSILTPLTSHTAVVSHQHRPWWLMSEGVATCRTEDHIKEFMEDDKMQDLETLCKEWFDFSEADLGAIAEIDQELGAQILKGHEHISEFLKYRTRMANKTSRRDKQRRENLLRGIKPRCQADLSDSDEEDHGQGQERQDKKLRKKGSRYSSRQGEPHDTKSQNGVRMANTWQSEGDASSTTSGGTPPTTAGTRKQSKGAQRAKTLTFVEDKDEAHLPHDHSPRSTPMSVAHSRSEAVHADPTSPRQGKVTSTGGNVAQPAYSRLAARRNSAIAQAGLSIATRSRSKSAVGDLSPILSPLTDASSSVSNRQHK